VDTAVEKQTFCQRVVAAASSRPDKVAMMVIEPKGAETVTFASMLAQIRSIAYRLGQEQVAFGERVGIIGENHPNWAIAYLGILYRGAVVTPLDPAATTGTLANVLKDSEAKLAFVSLASLESVSAAASCEAILSRICCRTPAKKLLSDLCHNLRISHPVGWFDPYYVSAEVVFLQSFFELTLCLTGTKYQNRFRLTNA